MLAIWLSFSLWDNGSGNNTYMSQAVSYATVFRSLRSAFDRKIDEKIVPQDSPSALWTLQTWHLTEKVPFPQWRLAVTDNFYTLHTLVEQIKHMSDNEVSILGTVLLTNVDGVNPVKLKRAIERL